MAYIIGQILCFVHIHLATHFSQQLFHFCAPALPNTIGKRDWHPFHCTAPHESSLQLPFQMAGYQPFSDEHKPISSVSIHFQSSTPDGAQCLSNLVDCLISGPMAQTIVDLFQAVISTMAKVIWLFHRIHSNRF